MISCEAMLRDNPRDDIMVYVLEGNWNAIISVTIRSLCPLLEWQDLFNEKTGNICEVK